MVNLVLSQSDAESIGKELLSRVTAPKAVVMVQSGSSTTASFTRNEVHDLAGSKGISAYLAVDFLGKRARMRTERIDKIGLANLVKDVEAAAMESQSGEDNVRLVRPAPFIDPAIYYDSSINACAPSLQGDMLRTSAGLAEASDLTGAGDLNVTVRSRMLMNTIGLNAYSRNTFAQYSVTCRTANGKGSGWAWFGDEDFSRVDASAITRKAIDIAAKSNDPVAIEPGRYTVIIEPEALTSLVYPMIETPTSYMSLTAANNGGSVFSVLKNKMPAGNKIGQQMLDRRLQMSFDPRDPELPFSPLADDGHIISPVQWFKDGVLQTLAYGPGDSKALPETMRRSAPERVDNPGVARMEFTGPATSLEEMIASTQRGVWIHRFGGASLVNMRTLLLTGVTRDGTFLIENGRITKAIKNFRFLESPFFVLNKIEAFGKPVRTSGKTLMPRVMVRDFEFTSLSEAV